jgi:methylmalonyl-CoA mutase
MDDLPLAADFPAATRENWLQLVERVLKGGDIETLVARTYEGLRVEPLYAKAEGPERPLLPAHGRWRIAQRVDHPNPETANALALADLDGGADALTLVFPEAASARGFGLGARHVDHLDRALRDVKLDLIQLRVEAGGAGFDAAALVASLAERRGHPVAELDLDLGLDPIGAIATGRLAASWDIVAALSAETMSSLSRRGFGGRAFLADGRPYHEAGAGEAQELAAVLATGAAYLRALEAGGHDPGTARNALSFLLVADVDQFLTTVKFRALRRLWARIEAASGLDAKPIRLHAETAWRMATRRDPWLNMLRSTVAAFAAGVGGADSIAVLPFTAALGLPDAFARRIARNTQLILLEEANLWRVADPTAGAGGFEALTDALCEKAWSLFQKIEREGGLIASLQAGALQARIAAVREERQHAIATRSQPITGTSEFPNLAETEVKVLLPSPSSGKAKGRDDLRADKDEAQTLTSSVVAPLPSIRDAEAYEHLRDASDAQLARTGARPRIVLANLGGPADFTARAGFARNLFEAGGIEAVTSEGLASPEAAAAAFAASGARLACICSSDQVYENLAAPVAKALRSAGARAVYVAGHPSRLQEHLGEPALVSFVFAGCDALAILREASETAAT